MGTYKPNDGYSVQNVIMERYTKLKYYLLSLQSDDETNKKIGK